MITQSVVGVGSRPAVIGHRLAVAAAVLLGTFMMGLGTTWDISWHATVGRDTFWIPPHLVIYGGTILTIVALVNAWVREVSWPRLPGDDECVRIGPWRVAGGIALSTVGGVWFLASAPFDDLWHRLFGLDVTLWSPPHISLMAGAWTMVLGALVLIVRERRRLDRVAPDRGSMQRRLELALLVLGLGFLLQPVSLALVPAIRYSYLSPGPLGAWLLPLLIAAVIPALVFAAPPVLRAPAGVTVPVLVQLALRPIGVGFAALGYAVVFPGGVPAESPIPGLSSSTVLFGLTFVPLLLLAPALLADVTMLAMASRTRAWMVAAGVFGAVVTIEGMFGPMALGDSARPLIEVVSMAPVLATVAIVSARIGEALTQRIVGARERPDSLMSWGH